MTATEKKDERTPWQRLRDVVKEPGVRAALGAGVRGRELAGHRSQRVLARCDAEGREALREDWQDEAAEAAVAGNPARARYLEHMGRRLLR